MKNRLFIDFDGTIFETKKFEKTFFETLIKAGISESELRTAYQLECLTYRFSLNSLVYKLHEKINFNLKLTMARLDSHYLKIPGNFIYPDVVSFLQGIDRSKFSVELLTLGDPEFQKKKIKLSNILPYFDKTYYTTEQKWNWLKNEVKSNERFVIIDDRGDTIYEIGKIYKNALALEINRSDLQSDPMEPRKRYANIVVRNLKQAGMYLQS